MAAVLTEKSRALLEKRYLYTDARGNKESIDGMFRRMSGGSDEYYELLTSLDALPNSPCFFNAHTGRGTVFACYTFYVSDSMSDGPDSIMGTADKAAVVAKWGGGVGYYLGNIRPKGSAVNSTHRKACGPCAVLRHYNSLGDLITQGGKRALAQIGILPADHADIEEFIDLKSDPQLAKTLANFNISAGWPDPWMEEVLAAKSGRALDIFNRQVDRAWKTGCPGVWFPDTVNLFNETPYLGLLLAPNPCGEVPLYSDEPCDIGSMNLVSFVTKNRTIDFTRLYERSRIMARYLDHLHDIDKVPVPQIRAASLLTRKIGLGVMGWADALCLLHVHYDTPEALALDEKVMACVNQAACDESLAMAKKYGPFPGYDADRAAAPPYRNATRTCIAPTGSIYLIAGLDSSGIEPHYDTEWDRKTYDGMVLKEKVNAVERSGGFVPKTANEIGWEWHVDHQAAFQKHVSLACSKTVNLPEGATRNDVASAYKRMWQKKCKGGTVYRNNCRSDQVLAKPGTHTFVMGSYDRVPSTNGVAAKNPGAPRGAPGQTPPNRHRLPRTCQALRHKIEMPGFEGYLHVGLTSGGMPGEIFLTANKEGSTVGGLLDAWAKSVSMALQYGTPLEGLVKLHVGMRFEPSGATGCPDVPHACSLPDYVFRFLAKRFLGEKAEEAVSGDSGAFCPDCDAPALLQGGCLVCSDKACGWSRCG